MESFNFYWSTPDGIPLRVDVDIDEYGELQEWRVSLELTNPFTNKQEVYDFDDRLSEAERDEIIEGVWDEMCTYQAESGYRE